MWVKDEESCFSFKCDGKVIAWFEEVYADSNVIAVCSYHLAGCEKFYNTTDVLNDEKNKEISTKILLSYYKKLAKKIDKIIKSLEKEAQNVWFIRAPK